MRKVLGALLGKLFYQPRVDREGNPARLRPFLGKLNQKLMENGRTLPWIMTKQECLDFFRATSNSRGTGEDKEKYASSRAGIINLTHSFWSPEVAKSDSILELGSGSGGNLNHLHKLGYTNLTGVEINQANVDEMRRFFPELTARCQIFIGSLEELLPGLATDSVDVVLNVAVAMHIHPASNFLFQEMRRIAKKYILLVEPETANCSYIFARDYRRLFHNLGLLQLKSAMITKEAFPGLNRDYDGYTARLFSAGK